MFQIALRWEYCVQSLVSAQEIHGNHSLIRIWLGRFRMMIVTQQVHVKKNINVYFYLKAGRHMP